MPTVDFAPWVGFHDDPATPRVAHPLRHYYVGTRQDIIDVIRAAEEIDSKPKVRASGSHWALSDAAMTTDFVVETRDPKDASLPCLNRQLFEVIPDCMTAEAVRFFIAQGVTKYDEGAPVDPSKFYLFHVESGVRIYELYSMLDAGDDAAPKSLAARVNDATVNYNGPWAMPTLGGAGGQTIVGAFSTGTHGGDVHIPPIADAVQAMHLIGPGGREYWIERELAPGYPQVVDDAKIKALYNEIQVIRDPDTFRAVLVSAGRMGIIYSVVLRVMRQYALHVLGQDKDGWSNVRKWVGDPTHSNFANRFVQVLINPNTDADNKDHSCWVTLRDMQPLGNATKPELGRAERGILGVTAGNSAPLEDPHSGLLDTMMADIYNAMCASDQPITDQLEHLKNIAEAARDAALLLAYNIYLAMGFTFGAAAAALEVQLEEALAAAATAQATIMVITDLQDTLAPGPLYNTLGTVANWAAANDHIDIFRALADAGIGSQAGSHNYTAISYAIMDVHNYLDQQCLSWGDSLEAFFDFSSKAAGKQMVAYVDKILQNNADLNNGLLMTGDAKTDGMRMVFPGYVSLRFMGQTSALIGMEKWGTTCSIEIAGTGTATGTEPFLAAAERDAIQMGAMAHWGQRNNMTMKEVERLYGAFYPSDPLYRWRAALASFTDNGRLATFQTDFTRQRGLEIIIPKISDFVVTPTNGCAGEEVSVSWDASHNPVETEVELQVLPPDSSVPEQTIALSGLSGSQMVALPNGRKVFRLAAMLMLNGRMVPTYSTFDVHGYADGDIWAFSITPDCQSVDGILGVARWSSRISFASTVSPKLSVAKLGCWFDPMAAVWHVRPPGGLAEMTFTPSAVEQVMTAKPSLQGEWVFYIQAAGCSGPPPALQVQFHTTCAE
jgi:hypothetical protein